MGSYRLIGTPKVIHYSELSFKLLQGDSSVFFFFFNGISAVYSNAPNLLIKVKIMFLWFPLYFTYQPQFQKG